MQNYPHYFVTLSNSNNTYAYYYLYAYSSNATTGITTNVNTYSGNANLYYWSITINKSTHAIASRSGNNQIQDVSSRLKDMGKNWTSWQMYVVDIKDYTFTVNNNDVVNPVTIQDGFFANKDSFNMIFGVYPTENSEDFGWYFATQKYIARFTLSYNNETITYVLPSYKQVYPRLTMEEYGSDITNVDNKYTTSYYELYGNSMVGLAYMEYDNILPPIGTGFENMIVKRSVNFLYLTDLLSALQTDYSGITINDLYQNIRFDILDDSGNSMLTKYFDYSSLYNTGVTPPAKDPNQQNQTQDDDILNQYLTSNNYYLNEIVNGPVYNNKGYEDMTYPELNNIDLPSITYTVETIDSSAIGFLSWLVNWWYTSPFGLIAICALTFLVIRTILW